MAPTARSISLAIGASKPAAPREYVAKPEQPVLIAVPAEFFEIKKSYLVLAERPEILAQFPANIRWMIVAYGLDG